MELVLKKGVLNLMGEVVNAGLCTGCGACVGTCPYIKVYREQVVMIDACQVPEGQCYDICPRTSTDYEALNNQVFGKGRDDAVLGTHRQIVNGRAGNKSTRADGQYGGTVSALVKFALETKLADSAILAQRGQENPLLPEPVIVTKPEDVSKTSGSKYTACPNISVLDRALMTQRSPLVVGRACQVAATRKKQGVNDEAQRVPLVIGLFCMWALNYRALERYLSSKIDLTKVSKFDIPYGEFAAHMKDGGKVNFDFNEIKGLRLTTCDLCYDFTSELADISIGSTELEDDWNTVIVRTERGEKFFQQALDAGVVESKPFLPERRDLLRKAAAGKKERTIAALKERFGKDGASPLGYLKLSEKELAGGLK